MNFLAHLHLADPTPSGWRGALLGDFVKGNIDALEPHALRESIRQHRRIDAFTDAHPVVRRSRGRIPAPRRRFAGILVDMFYDHFLARHWRRYSREPLEAFAERVYRSLETGLESFPERAQRTAASMASNDWLVSYRELGSVDRALRGVSARLSRANPLGTGGEDLRRNYRALEGDFLSFYPELAAFSRAASTSGAEQASGGQGPAS